MNNNINNIERNITITLEKAREWYNSGNTSLKEVALQAFSKEELTVFDFTKIKTFEDALTALEYTESTKAYIRTTINDIRYSTASAAMLTLNIIRKALNLGQDLHFIKSPENSHIYYPYNPYTVKNSTYYEDDVNSGKMEVIGRIKNDGIVYDVFGGRADYYGYSGLGDFRPHDNVGFANASDGFLGCASEEIAQHFGKYFGMLITEAKYGDLPNFKVIESKY